MSDREVGGGSGDRRSNWAPSASATTARSSSRGDRKLALGQEKRLPQACGMDSHDGVKQSLTAASSSSGFTARVDGELEKNGRERPLEGIGRDGAELTAAARSGEQVTLQSQRAESGARPSGLDQEDIFEEHPGWKGESPSSNIAGVEGYRGRAQSGRILAIRSRRNAFLGFLARPRHI